jgi:hypothetical protein
LAHRVDHTSAYLQAVREAFAIIAEGVTRGDAAARLAGPPARRGFYRLT